MYLLEYNTVHLAQCTASASCQALLHRAEHPSPTVAAPSLHLFPELLLHGFQVTVIKMSLEKFLPQTIVLFLLSGNRLILHELNICKVSGQAPLSWFNSWVELLKEFLKYLHMHRHGSMTHLQEIMGGVVWMLMSQERN